MIPSQTFEQYPIFGGNATKVEPGDAKKSAGFQQADVLPAEWMNWAWNKNSKGISDLNEGVTSLEKEVNNVLAEAHISPSSDTNVNNQLFKAVQKNNGCIITDAATPAVITNAPAIEAGNVVKVMFGADVTGGNTTTAMLISYNGSNITVKVNKNGAKTNFVATEVSSGTYKYLQAYTTLELVYDGVDFLIVGNPVVLSGSNYTVYADGKKGVDDSHPVNSIYIQYPSQSAPGVLFGLTTWTDVSSYYAGAFFRAAGGRAASFIENGTLTPQSDMIKTHTTGGMSDHATGAMNANTTGGFGNMEIAGFDGNMSSSSRTTDEYAKPEGTSPYCLKSLKIDVSHTHTYGNSNDNPETRPVNYTIKIWKRTA
jgi:hypothetical protein